ncbi:MAG: glycosyltransferase family 4 protein [Lachnospiraceae bacterium]|nr:glycosyltransferase family 4 protein [Lachnospiraceae bacterium]
MRIVFITHYDNMYGANMALKELLIRIKAEGTHEAILVLPADGMFAETMRSAGIEVYVCGVTQWQAIWREPVSFAVKSAKRRKAMDAEVTMLYEHFKDRGIDAVHSNSSVIGTGAMLAEKLGCRHFWHIREFAHEHYGCEYFYPEETVKRYYESADCLIAISDAIKDYMREKYPSANVVRIYDGIEKAEKPERPLREVRNFIYISYLFPAKQQLELLKAAAELKKKGYKDFRIIFAGGGDKAYEKKLKAYAAKHGLKEAEFMGYVNDIPALLTECDAGIMISDHEGFGLATVEYMRAGLPVIGYTSGATPEIVRDSETGLLCTDLKELSDKMDMLMKDKELAHSMGDAGYERAMKCFTSEINVSAVLELYRSIGGR